MKIEWIEKYLTEAEQLFYNDKTDEGFALMTNLLYDEPGYGSLHNHLGWAHLYYSMDNEKAERHLKLAVKFNPEFPAPYLHLGTLCIRMNRFAEAVEYLEKGLVKPEAYRVTFLEKIGNAHELGSRLTEAIRAYKKALVATVGPEASTIEESIKRCRKKRWALMFSF